ncbi:glutamate receptor ionotropic, kainate, partial [Plakobranchus ocellatus]
SRPIDLEDKLLSFSHQTVEIFFDALQAQADSYNCSLDCSSNCSGCQRLFKEGLNQISGQDFEIFPKEAEDERRKIWFDIYRFASDGNIQVGWWSASEGLSLKQSAYPPNFTDNRLTVIVVVEPPFVFKNDTDPDNVSYYGYSIDVLSEIAKRVGFEYNVAECSSGGYGFLENGHWNGCIGNIVRGEADVILGALTVTVERDKVMDFTLPYYDFAGIQIMMKKEDSSTKLFYYASVFTTPAWLSILAVLTATSILLWAFERITQPRPYRNNHPSHKQETNQQLSCNEPSNHDATLSTISSEFFNLTVSSNHCNQETFTSHFDGDKISPSQKSTKLSNGDDNGNTKSTPNENKESDTEFHLTSQSHTNSTATLISEDQVVSTDVYKRNNRQWADADNSQNNVEKKDNSAYTIGDSIWFVVGALTMAGGGDPPKSIAGRVLVAGFWFFTVIIMSTFTANLAAFLTVSRLGTSISSLDDLAAQNEINYSAVKDTSVMEYFKRMANIENNFYEDWKSMSFVERTDQESRAVWDYPLGNKYNAIWKTIQRTGLIDTNQEGLDKVRAGGFALITESPIIRYYTSLHCDLEAVGEQFSTRPYAIGLKDKFPYTSDFSQAILDLQKDRVLGDLQFKWWSEDSGCMTENTNEGLGLYLLSGTFIVAGAGLALGVIALGLEHIIIRLRRPKESRDLIALYLEAHTVNVTWRPCDLATLRLSERSAS